MDDQWRDQAECRDAPDPNRFLEASTAKEEQLLIAMYCSVCPVSDLCYDVAINTPPSRDIGIWGGTTERQRTLHRKRGRNAPKRDA